MTKVAIVQFPGSNCDLDTLHVLKNVMKVEASLVWHQDRGIDGYDAVILPGGFAYGDYLRAGVIAAHSPIMEDVKRCAEKGRPVLGICNGFQILVEAGLLPGSVLRNECLKFVCRWVRLRTETDRTPWSSMIKVGSTLQIPIAHNEGRFFIDRNGLRKLCENDQVVFRYVDEQGAVSRKGNPNGSLDSIAGICNCEGNVVGLMPHPERASERILCPCGRRDGRIVFESLLSHLKR